MSVLWYVINNNIIGPKLLMCDMGMMVPTAQTPSLVLQKNPIEQNPRPILQVRLLDLPQKPELETQPVVKYRSVGL